VFCYYPLLYILYSSLAYISGNELHHKIIKTRVKKSKEGRRKKEDDDDDEYQMCPT